MLAGQQRPLLLPTSAAGSGGVAISAVSTSTTITTSTGTLATATGSIASASEPVSAATTAIAASTKPLAAAATAVAAAPIATAGHASVCAILCRLRRRRRERSACQRGNQPRQYQLRAVDNGRDVPAALQEPWGRQPVAVPVEQRDRSLLAGQ